MSSPRPTLDDLVTQFRVSAVTDVQLAQRVALACCKLIEVKEDPLAAIRIVFRIPK